MTVTIFIPALNEEKNLADAVADALEAVKVLSGDYEILILDACSSDRTGVIADELAVQNPQIRVIHQKKWAGLGANYMEGVMQAKMEYFVLFPGDNENSWQSLAQAIAKIGAADIIVSYTINMEVRAMHRRLISSTFVWLLNRLFGLSLQYYNGNAIYKTSDLQRLDLKSQDFAYNAEILIKLIKSGCSFTEFGIQIKPTGKTTIFNIRNILGVIKTIFILFYDVRIKDKERYHQVGVAIS
jgi:dolichol-phosphate mannosyltransferase